MRAIVLSVHSLDEVGGFPQFTRELLLALSYSEEIDKVVFFSRRKSSEASFTSAISTRGQGINSFFHCKSLPSLLWKSFLSGCGVKSTGDRVVICSHISLLPVAAVVAFVSRSRLLLWIHGIEAWWPNYPKLIRRFLLAVDYIASVSEFSLTRFQKWSGGVSAPNRVVSHGIDLDRFHLREPSLSDQVKERFAGRKIVITVGNLIAGRPKGQREFIKALPAIRERLPNLLYVVVGEGESLAELQQEAIELGVSDNVYFAGRLSDDEILNYLAASDVFFMASQCEGFGIAYLEAHAMGLKVIGSKHDASLETLAKGGFGVVVDPREQAEIVEKVIELLSDQDGESADRQLPYEFTREGFQQSVEALLKDIASDQF